MGPSTLWNHRFLLDGVEFEIPTWPSLISERRGYSLVEDTVEAPARWPATTATSGAGREQGALLHYPSRPRRTSWGRTGVITAGQVWKAAWSPILPGRHESPSRCSSAFSSPVEVLKGKPVSQPSQPVDGGNLGFPALLWLARVGGAAPFPVALH